MVPIAVYSDWFTIIWEASLDSWDLPTILGTLHSALIFMETVWNREQNSTIQVYSTWKLQNACTESLDLIFHVFAEILIILHVAVIIAMWQCTRGCIYLMFTKENYHYLCHFLCVKLADGRSLTQVNRPLVQLTELWRHCIQCDAVLL